MLEVIRQRYFGLGNVHRQEVSQPSVLRNAFVNEMSSELNLETEVVETYLNMVVAADNQDVTALIEMMGLNTDSLHHLSGLERQRQFVDWHNEMVLLPQAESLIIRSRMEQGMSYQEAKSKDIDSEDLRRTMHTLISRNTFFYPRPELDIDENDKKTSLLIKDIPTLLKQGNLSKTQILKKLGKDNPSWRGLADDVLEYLVITQKVRQVGNQYYHIESAPKIYETDIHRRVYEAVLDGKQSISAIAKAIKYDNTRGRKRVEAILVLLQRENLVQLNDNNTYQKWSIVN